MSGITKFFKDIKQKRQEKKELRQKLRSYHARLSKLEAAMDRLISDHMVMKSIDDYYPYISKYIGCQDTKEYNYCKNYINSKVSKGYFRYDNER